MAIDNIIRAESNGNPRAQNPRSSAGGLGQFIDSTWLDMVARNRPDLMQGRDRAGILSLKYDPEISREMTGHYARENGARLQAAGLPVNDGTTYLAHFAGPDGAIKILQADPNASAVGILGDKVGAANPFMRDMTASQLAAWANNKMGGQPQPPAQPPAPDMADWYSPQAQPGQPMGILPPAAQSQGVLPQQQSSGVLDSFTPSQGKTNTFNQPPPEFANLAALLPPIKRQAPTRGLLHFKGY